jgi:hypothetical protein
MYGCVDGKVWVEDAEKEGMKEERMRWEQTRLVTGYGMGKVG